MAIPTNGLVFYAPLAEDKATAETGQTFTKTGTITQAKIDGIPCSYFNGSSYIRVDLSTMPYGTDDFAFSLWARCDGDSGVVLQLGSWTTGARLSQLGDGMLQAWLRGTVDLRTTEAYDRMVHVAATRNSGTSSLYINGSLVATSQESAELSQYTQISLMNSYTNGPRYITGYLAAVRLYNRGLSTDEITELANEFSGIDDGTGVVIDGLFLSNSRPKAGDKGLLVNNKFFIPFAKSSGGGSAEFYKCASVDTSAKTWSGYKAVFDSTAGTWSFSDTVTEGLSYTSVTPVVGGIYSADALVIVSLLYTGTPTLTSPTGMTSESSDEWEISAKSNYSAYYPWKAFDGLSSPFTNCWSSQTAKDQWLQWHNKKQKVLVQRLKLSVTDAPAQGPAEFILQGSDDGTLWHDIHSESGLSWTTNGEAKEFAFSNNKSYYYHRLNEMWADSNVVSILELETYDM